MPIPTNVLSTLRADYEDFLVPMLAVLMMKQAQKRTHLISLQAFLSDAQFKPR